MHFSKEHLLGRYEWHLANERSEFDGDATRRLFNRYNGNQVLFVINVFLMQYDIARFEEYGRKAELLLIDNLPLAPMSEISVLQWLNHQFFTAVIADHD